MNDDETTWIAAFGSEVDAWFRGNLGRYVLERAQAEVEEAQAALLDVDPTNTPQIEQLQRKAANARGAVLWLNDAIQDGETAFASLRESEG